MTVLLGHIEQFKRWSGLPLLVSGERFNEWVDHVPANGVMFFLVLSGFLITYLLFRELRQTGTIAVRKFYFRRILRIWPLYYLLIFLELAAAPALGITQPHIPSHFWPNLLLFLFFLPQVATVLYPELLSAGLWSLGVEEIFYLIWPWAIRTLKRHLVYVLGVVIATSAWVRSSETSFRSGLGGQKLINYFGLIGFDWFLFLALGAMGAWIWEFKPSWSKIIFRREIQAITYFFAIKHVIYFQSYGAWDDLVHGIVYLLLIMNVALNPKTWVRFESPTLRWLGERSYGIYMFQFLGIQLSLLLWHRGWNNALLYATSISLTLFSAAISYRFFEKPLLSLKARFRPLLLSGRLARIS